MPTKPLPREAALGRFTVWKKDEKGDYIEEHECLEYMDLVSYLTVEKVAELGKFRITHEVTVHDSEAAEAKTADPYVKPVE